jgi:hypothetical protein
MSAWTSDELRRIEQAEELEIAGRKPDNTLRKSTTIWVVRVGDELYVRSVYGRSSGWFKGVQAHHEGRIQAGGVEKDVRFVEIDVQDGVHERIDAAYRQKYRRYAQNIIDSTLSSRAHAATMRLVPASVTP